FDSRASLRLAQIKGKSLPGADEFADRSRLHLPHDAAAMELDGDIADSEVEGDLLVEASAGHLAEHLPLTRRKRRQPLDIGVDEQSFLSAGHVSFNSGGYGVEQRLISNRLREEVDRTELHGLYRHRNVAMSGEKNNWRCVTLGSEASLEIES